MRVTNQSNPARRRSSFFILVSWLSARLRWSILEFPQLSLQHAQPKAIVNRIPEDRQQLRLPPSKWVFDSDRLYCLHIDNSTVTELIVREISYIGRN